MCAESWWTHSPKDHSLLPSSQAAVGVEYCNRLFALEKKFAGLSPENRNIQRQELSKPVLDAFFAWANSCKPAAGTALSKAIAYALSERKYLLAFLEDPLVPISNNRALFLSIIYSEHPKEPIGCAAVA